jgi:DNA polymerase-3 subunit gamma/tau
MGPRGTGKTSTARILAKSINCVDGPTAQPCQKCTSCLEIAAGTSPSVFEIDAASNNSVDDARALIEKTPLVAVGGRYKLYIIDECHMLSREAFNALLKTLEEPPPNVIFVLATTEEHKVPLTIVSRCQKLMFRLLDQETIAEYLTQVSSKESLEIEPEAIELIARQARGGMRDALGMLDQAALLSAPGQPVRVPDLLNLLGFVPEDILLEISSCMLNRDGKKIMECAQQLLIEGREPSIVAAELARHCLNLARASYIEETQTAQAQHSALVGSNHYIQALIQQSRQFEHIELAQIVEQLDRLEQVCRRSTQPALHLEVGLLSICHRHQIPSLQDLANRIQQLEQGIPSGIKEKPASVSSSTPTPSKSTSISSTKAPSTALPPAEGTPSPIPPPPKITAEAPKAASIDIQAFWAQLITALSERHRPTWSLVSTHAFPIRVNSKELVLGVQKEQFQKMIEGKAEHICSAATVILGSSPAVRVRVAEGEQLKAAQSNASAALQSSQSAEKKASVRSQKNSEDTPSSSLKEAYRLFEGPGSRQIG